MPTFMQYIFGNRRNRPFFWAAILISTLGRSLLKIAYPYSDLFSDSYSYIGAAIEDLDTNIWPIAYSKSLFTLHSTSQSDTALVGHAVHPMFHLRNYYM